MLRGGSGGGAEGAEKRPERKSLACDFCGSREELVTCTWTVADARVLKAVEDAEVGDVWVTQQAGKRGRVVEIVGLGDLGTSRQLWVLIPGHPKPYAYIRYNGDLFESEGAGPCGLVACFRHAREVSERGHWCVDHWAAWENAA
jgi:hypothetical protein